MLGGARLLLQAPFTGGPSGIACDTCEDTHRGHRPSFVRAAQLTPRVLHRSPPSDDTLENSVCSKHPHRTAECLSMECRGNDQSPLGPEELCWSWSPLRASWGVLLGCFRRGPASGPAVGRHGGSTPPPAVPPARRRRRCPRASPHGPQLARHRTEPMGPLEVEGISAPEVKFLDRCETTRSEGALQVRVRRSRMRVRGAKMIRHRRSPATVNGAGEASAGHVSRPCRGHTSHIEKSTACGFRGEYCRKAET